MYMRFAFLVYSIPMKSTVQYFALLSSPTLAYETDYQWEIFKPAYEIIIIIIALVPIARGQAKPQLMRWREVKKLALKNPKEQQKFRTFSLLVLSIAHIRRWKLDYNYEKFGKGTSIGIQCNERFKHT